MKAFIFSLFLFLVFTDKTSAQSDEKLIKQSYQLAFGADPSAENLKSWLDQGARPFNVEQLIEQHKTYLSQNINEQRKVIVRAFSYCYGTAPSNEVESYLNTSKRQSGMVYRQVASELKQWLATHDDNQRAVIIKSYQDALGINPTEGNIASWMNACKGNGCNYAQLYEQIKNCKNCLPPPPVTQPTVPSTYYNPNLKKTPCGNIDPKYEVCCYDPASKNHTVKRRPTVDEKTGWGSSDYCTCDPANCVQR
jgi:hypothetical protein